MANNFDIDVFRTIEEEHLQEINNHQLQPNDNEEVQQPRILEWYDVEKYLNTEDDQDMLMLTSFTCQQFRTLYNLVEPQLVKAHSGGRRSRLSPLTIFFITLVYLKSAMPLTTLGFHMGLSLPYISTLITETVSICSPILAKTFIKWIHIDEYVRNRCCFQNFPQCVCAVDGSVQRIPRPTVNQAEFYSGKHHHHCVKMQVAVGPIGLAVDVSGPYPGSVHDYKIFRDLSSTRYKIDAEKERRQRMFPGQPTVSALFDKGYIGVNNILAEPKLPYRKPPRRDLTPQEIDYNNKIGHDRIIVERWFGRLKAVWKIMYIVFPLKLDKYLDFYLMCAALTNYHIQNNPLTNGDPLDPFRYEDD